jgi:hypothetical protein
MIYANAPREGRDIRPRKGGRNQFIFGTSERASAIHPLNKEKENNAKKESYMNKTEVNHLCVTGVHRSINRRRTYVHTHVLFRIPKSHSVAKKV